MFGMPTGMEWGVVLLLVLIVFGAGRLPEAGRQIGRAIADMREPEPIMPESETEYSFDFIVAISLTIVAIACVFVLVLSQSSWV